MRAHFFNGGASSATSSSRAASARSRWKIREASATVNPCAGREAHLDLVARADVALGDDAQIRAGPQRPLEAAGHALVRGAHPELPARDPRLRHLELGAADPPALADHGVADVVAGDGQVLADESVLDLAAEFDGPEVEVLAGVGVDRLVHAGVVHLVGLPVAVDVVVDDLHPAGDRVA